MNKSYVFYNEETGKVTGVSNVVSENNNSPYILVDTKEVVDVLKGTLPMKYLIIEFNVKTKEFTLVNKRNYNELVDYKNINDYLYEVPEKYNKDYDILVEQNQKEKYWKLSIGDEIRKALTGSFLGNTINFSVTQKKNPNIFYNRLEFNMRQLVFNGFTILEFKQDFEIDNTPISLYTDKKFDTYVYQRIPK